MNDYEVYSKVLLKSVSHIFNSLLKDKSIEEIYETQASGKASRVAVELSGSMEGEIIISLPKETLNNIAKFFIGQGKKRVTNNISVDVGGELANLITGTFANLMQYADYDIALSPPEFNEDPIQIKALYSNINLSFQSSYGGFDVDLYYR